MYLSSIFFKYSFFPVCDWRQTVWIYHRDTFRVVISKRVSPDDCLDFLHGQFCRIKLIELFLFQRRKPTFHPCIIPAFPNSTHALDSMKLSERLFVLAACILASRVTMNYRSTLYIKFSFRILFMFFRLKNIISSTFKRITNLRTSFYYFIANSRCCLFGFIRNFQSLK